MASTDDIKDQVREALRKQKIKLWEPPYVSDLGEPVPSALEQLASLWVSNNIVTGTGVTDMLQEWQAHALNKLAAKKQPKQQKESPITLLDLQIKLLGVGEELDQKKHDLKASDLVKDVRVETKKGATILTLRGVPSSKTDTELMDFVRKVIPACGLTTARWIHRGKNLTLGQNKTLNTLFPQQTSVSLLCLVSKIDPDEQKRAEAHASIQTRIQAIRNAARQIRDTTKLDITDQHGKIVPMSGDDRLGFLTALALHRLGLNCSDNPQDALVMLLEADVEWNNHPNLNPWKDKVDNYGLLQLDIAWVYLQLESLSNLPDSLMRLQEAERVLKKQVHQNFVPLALTQAELGNAREVPPLAAVFAKLFLLQGIAYLCDSNENHNPSSAQKSKEKLDQAYVLLQSLRSVAPKDSVQQLLDVMGSGMVQGRQFIESDAIAALRKAQGDLDAAVVALADEETERRRLRRDREAQHQYGLCENEKDPVNVEHLETLKPLLQGQDNNNWASNTANTELAVGLLRLANNDLTRALELYAEQDYQPQKVHALVDVLDNNLVQRGLLGRAVLREKRKKRKLYDEASLPTVDEVSLATLMSMGVDEAKARKALDKSGNDVEKAMVWLFSETEEEETSAAAAAKSGKEDEDNSDHTPALQESDQNEAESANDDGALGLKKESKAEARMREMEVEAQELLHRELGDILEERDLEKEYLGKALNEEWDLVQKYRGSD